MRLSRFASIFAFLVDLQKTGSAWAITFQDVEHTFDTLQTWYNSDSGLWTPSTGWWNSANCLTTLANLAAIDEKMKERTMFLWDDVFTKAPVWNAAKSSTLLSRWRRGHFNLSRIKKQTREALKAGFINQYYDDEGWWALAWIAVYDLTRDQRYLDEAMVIFDDMNATYDQTPVGGLWWDKKHSYVNAIANELYFSVAAHLANRCSQKHSEYLSLAQKSWNWIYTSGMINNHNNIEDGMAVGSRPGNTAMVWSYNQGVVLSALTELSTATGHRQYVEIAKLIADAALSNLTSTNNAGILQDPCEATLSCGADGASFKGIFVRNLARLHSISPEDRYGVFLMKNAESLWQNARDQYNRLGLVWSGPFIEPANASTQCSGMDLLVSALAQLGEWQGNGTYYNGRAVSQDRVPLVGRHEHRGIK